MNDEEAISAIENMLVNLEYTPCEDYGKLTARESYRMYDARVSALRAAHPSLSDLDCEKLLLRVWLELSMEYDKSRFSYEGYLSMTDWWCEQLMEAPTAKLKDILSTIAESLILK
jgi:hypothetical protein